MRLDALLEMGAAEELAAEKDAAELQRVADRLRADGLAAEDKRFREWLGELVEDLEIDGPQYMTQTGYSGEFVSWEIRPRSWLVDWVISVHHDGEGYIFKHDYFIKSVDDPRLAKLFVKWQEEHDEEVKLLVAKWAKELATPRGPGCSDDEARLRDARVRLGKLAPERTDEWNALLAEALEALYEMWDEEAEKAAIRAAAVERYEEALEAWAVESAEARAHNAAVAQRLRERLGDVSMQVCEVEYAVVVREDGEAVLETRRVWAVGNTGGAPATFRVNEGGRVRGWTINHVVRVSEVVTATPETHSWLFPQAVIGDEWVYFVDGLPSHHEAVDAALAEAREMPEPPDWDEYGRGLYWGTDVDAAVRRATHDQADDEDEIAY